MDLDQEESVESIFSDSLALLGGQDLSETIDDAQLIFGLLTLTVAPKVKYARKAWRPTDRIKSDLFYLFYLTSSPQGREGTVPVLIMYGSPLSGLHQSLPSCKANTLLADHIFSPAFLLAERIERGLIDLSGRSSMPRYFSAACSPLALAVMVLD